MLGTARLSIDAVALTERYVENTQEVSLCFTAGNMYSGYRGGLLQTKGSLTSATRLVRKIRAFLFLSDTTCYP